MVYAYTSLISKHNLFREEGGEDKYNILNELTMVKQPKILGTSPWLLLLQAAMFTAEAMAIYKAVKYIHTEHTNIKTKLIILSDSLSNLICITNTQNPTDITKLILEIKFDL